MRFSPVKGVLAMALMTALIAPVAITSASTPAFAATSSPQLTAVVAHPRLLGDRAAFDGAVKALQADPVGSERLSELRSEAERLAGEAAPKYALPDGKLLDVSRSVLDRVYHFGFMWRMTGDSRWSTLGVKELRNAAAFRDWHPEHFIDTAEMMHAVGLGYDWFYTAMSSSDRQTVAGALKSKGLTPADKEYANKTSWTTGDGNWNLVSNSSVAIAALALGTDFGSSPQGSLDRAMNSVKAGLGAYGRDGGYDEGITYWSYGSAYAATLIDGLRTATGQDYGLGATPGLSQAAGFGDRMTGPSGLAFNYGDAWSNEGLADATLGLEYVSKQAPTLDKTISQSRTDINQMSPRGLLWLGKGLSEAFPKQALPIDSVSASAGVATMRGSFDDTLASFVAVRDGSKDRTGHADLDQGSFVFDALGQNWISDVGADSYGLPGYFDVESEQRWSYYAKRAEAHSTLVTNPGSGPDMSVQGNGKTAALRQSDGSGASVVMDLTGADSDLTSWQRGLRLFDGRKQLLVQDEVTPRGKVDFWSFMQTRATVEILADGRSAMLYQGGQRLLVRLVGGPGSLRAMDAAPMWSSPQPVQGDYSKVTRLMVHTEISQKTTFALQLTPMPSREVPAAVSVGRIQDWPSTSAGAKLSALTVDGVKLAGFAPGKFSYVQPASAKSSPPTVAATAVAGGTARVEQAKGVPGRATVTVSSGSTTSTYTIDFVRGAVTTAVKSTTSGDVARALDDDRYSAWKVSGRQTVVLDVLRRQPVSHLEFTWGTPVDKDVSYGIEVSDDAATWKRVYTGAPRAQNAAEWASFTTGATPARYLRLVINASASSKVVTLKNVSVLADNDAAAATDPKVDRPRLVATPTNSTIAVGSTLALQTTYEDKGSLATSALPPASFTTSDPGVATVSSTGQVRGVAPGQVTIGSRATVQGRLVFDVVTVSVYNPGIKKLLADQDAHVHGGGSNETTTFGRAEALVLLHKEPYPQFDRQGYISFDTKGIDKRQVKSAVLRLPTSMPGSPSTAKEPISAYAVASSWAERTITFANKPAMGALAGSAVVTPTNASTSLDVTAYVQGAAGGTLSFGLKQTSPTASAQVNIAAHESGVGAELTITYK